MGFDANISLHDLADSYFVPLKTCVQQTNLSGVMCSYSAINGTPSCANEWMNAKVLRRAWGWDGVIESDCGALGNIQSHFHYAKDGPSTAAAAMRGTCDVCDTTCMNNMSMQAGLGRSYRYLDMARSPPLWTFGAGLSYTSFKVELQAACQPSLQRGSSMELVAKVTNTGAVAGTDVLLVFASLLSEPPSGFSVLPREWIVAFVRTSELAPGNSESVRLPVLDEDLRMVNDAGSELVVAGAYNLRLDDGTTTLSCSTKVPSTYTLSTLPSIADEATLV